MGKLTVGCIGYTQKDIEEQFIRPARNAQLDIPNYKSITNPQQPRGYWFDLVIVKVGYQQGNKVIFDDIMEVMKHCIKPIS